MHFYIHQKTLSSKHLKEKVNSFGVKKLPAKMDRLLLWKKIIKKMME